MKEEKILEHIGQVKEEFIEEAAPKGTLEEKKSITMSKKTKIYRFAKWGALAACLCIIVGLGMKMVPFSLAKNDMAIDYADNMSPEEESKSLDYNAESPKFDMTTKAEFNFTQDVDTTIQKESFPDWGLTLSVENVTPTGLTLVVTQSGGNPTGDILTGEPYRLITLVGETWQVVEELPLPEGVDGRAFNSIGYWIQKGETREFDINWEWMFGELPSGTYRLIKEFSDFRETANYDPFEYWVEFVIQ